MGVRLLDRNCFTTKQVANALGIDKSTLLKWIKDGKIKDAHRDNRNWRVWREDDFRRAEKYQKTRKREVKVP